LGTGGSVFLVAMLSILSVTLKRCITHTIW